MLLNRFINTITLRDFLYLLTNNFSTCFNKFNSFIYQWHLKIHANIQIIILPWHYRQFIMSIMGKCISFLKLRPRLYKLGKFNLSKRFIRKLMGLVHRWIYKLQQHFSPFIIIRSLLSACTFFIKLLSYILQNLCYD